MLTWESEKELVKTIWLEPITREALRSLLRVEHFERPDMGWLVKLLLDEVGAAPTQTELKEKLNLTAAPHILEACVSLLGQVEKAERMDPIRAIDLGKKLATYREAQTLAGQLETLVRTDSWGELRNRFDGLCNLAGQVALEQVDGLVVKRASDVAAERVSWLWPGFIPYGKVSTMEGNGGLGKSSLMLDLAARASTGRIYPLGTDTPERAVEPADAIILSAEDGAADTIRPRLEAAGAALERIHLVSGVNETYRGEVQERGIALDRDVMRLENLVIKTNAKLLVIDPIVAMLGGTVDFHRDQDVRRVLKALAGLAERRKCAVVTIRHLNKDKSGELISRGGGSIGFVAAVRVAMIVVKHPTSSEDRVVAVYKSNLSRPPDPVIYRFDPIPDSDVARISWTQKSSRTVEELIKPESAS